MAEEENQRRSRWALESERATFVKPGEPPVEFQGWDGLADCAHFLSSCLKAGGIEIKTDFVPYVNSFLRNLSFTKAVGDELSREAAQRIIDKGRMFAGDVILYVAPPGGELGGVMCIPQSL